MKKLLFALPLVAGVSWAGTTLYTGSQTRDAYDQLIAQLDQMSGLVVSNESYSAGFMKSLAVTSVRVSTDADSPVILRLQHEISHSPVDLASGAPRVGTALIETTLLTDQIKGDWAALLASFDDGQPFVLTSHVDFAGNTSSEFVVNRLHLETADTDPVTVDFAGAALDFTHDTAGKFDGKGSIGELSVVAANGMRALVQAGTTEADLDRVSDGIYSGTQSITFPRFELTDADGQTLGAIDGVTVATEAKVDGDRLSSGSTFRVAAIDSPLPVTSGSLDFSVNGLSLAGLQAYREVSSQIALATPDSLGDNELAITVLDAFKQVIVPGTGVQYAVTLNNDGGAADAALSLTFKGDGSASGRDSMATVGDLLRAMTGSLRVKADAEALAMTPAPMLLASPGVSAYVLDDGVSYSTEVDVADLIVTINGEPLSLELMLDEMLAMPLDLAMLSNM